MQAPGIRHPLLQQELLPTINFIGEVNAPGSGATWSYSNAPIGVADDASRLVVACVKGMRDAGGTISSATIGGVAATVIEGASVANGSEFIIAAVVPTGTTATVTVNWSITQVGTRIAVYVLRWLKSTTPVSTARSTTVSSLAITINTISPPSNSIVIAHTNAQNNTTWTWSGTAGLQENFGSNSGSVYNHSGASAMFPAPLTTPTIIATVPSAWTSPQMSVACWQ